MTAKAKQDIHYSEDTRLALLEQSIGHINETLMRFEKRFDHIDSKFDHIDSRFDHIDSKFNHIDNKFNHIDNKFGQIDGKLASSERSLRADMQSHFYWSMGSMLGLYAIVLSTLIGIVGKIYGVF